MAAQNLPGSVIEELLTYLPEEGVAILPLVCVQWNNEIRNSSPNLWKHLLNRRGWKLPSIPDHFQGASSQDCNKATRDIFYNTFVSHFRVSNDLERVRKAAQAIPIVFENYNKIHCKRDDDTEISSEYFDRSDVRRDLVALKRYWTNTKCPRNFCTAECIAVRIWSPTQALGAYEDGTLRFVQAVGKNQKDGSVDSIENARIHTAPVQMDYNSGEKLNLVAMDVDDNSVGCLFDVQKDVSWDDDIRNGDPILVILTRQEIMKAHYYPKDLGLGEYATTRHQHEFNIRQCARDHILLQLPAQTDAETENELEPIYQLLRNGGSISDVGVSVSKNLVACGKGMFMMEVAFQLPDDRQQRSQVDRRLVIFSLETSAFMWMSPFSTRLSPTNREAVSIAGSKIARNGASDVTRVAVVTVGSPFILVIDVEEDGSVQIINKFGTCPNIYQEVTTQGWDTTFVSKRPMAVCAKTVVTGDTLSLNSDMMDDANKNGFIKSFISFYPVAEEGECEEIDSRVTALELKGNTTVLRLIPMGPDHILAVCLAFDWEGAGQQGEPLEEMNELDFDFDFDMLGNYIDRVIRSTSLCAVLIHMESKQEIARVTVDDRPIIDREFSWDATFLVATRGDVIAVGVSHDGLLLTSAQIRAAGPSNEESGDEKRLEWGGCEDEWSKDAALNTCEGSCPDCDGCKLFDERRRHARYFRDDDSDSDDGWP